METDKKRLWIKGVFVEVEDDVYTAYVRGDRKMRYFEKDLKVERVLLDDDGNIAQIIPSREDSLDRLMDENTKQFTDEDVSVEDDAIHNMTVKSLHKAMSLLDKDEQKLIKALFFSEKKERDVALEYGISQPAINKRKNKILSKLKFLLEN